MRRTQAGLAIVRRHEAVRGGWPEMFCLWNVVNAQRAAGDVDTSIAVFTQCAEMCEGRNGIAEMCTWNALGEIWEERGEYQKAREAWERSLRNRQEIGATNVGYVHGSTPLNLLALARMAVKQGQQGTAAKLLSLALPLAEATRDAASVRKITELLAQTSRAEPAQRATLRPEGGVWHIAFNGKALHVPDLQGLWHLRELVSRPREAILALALLAAPNEEPVPMGDTGGLRSLAKRSGSIATGSQSSTGGSNFSAKKLRDLLPHSKIKPEVNQVELHPFLQQNALHAYCASERIHVTAYSPLSSGDRPAFVKAPDAPVPLENPVIRSIASAHGATPAQVLLAWHVQRGISTIPKSISPARLRENLAAARLELTGAELDRIRALD